MNDIFSSDTDRALKFGLVLDSLCKGGAEVLGASASPSGSRPSDQANLRCPDALRFDPSREECPGCFGIITLNLRNVSCGCGQVFGAEGTDA